VVRPVGRLGEASYREWLDVQRLRGARERGRSNGCRRNGNGQGLGTIRGRGANFQTARCTKKLRGWLSVSCGVIRWGWGWKVERVSTRPESWLRNASIVIARAKACWQRGDNSYPGAFVLVGWPA
jgi:hypothetical protein